MFITFEGIEGCGKSTQMRLAAEWLKSRGVNVQCSREPGGTRIGQEIRRILLSENSQELGRIPECLLYLADRFQHVQEIIRPQLLGKKVLLCDRYHDSTIAYQGYGRGIPLDFLDYVWNESGLALEPDVTFLFDLQPEIGIRRSLQKLSEAQVDESRFEKEALEFHRKVRAGFLSLAASYPDRIKVLDGTDSIESIHNHVVEHLRSYEIF